MRRAANNLALLCLLAMVALLALPRLVGGRPAGENSTGTAACAIVAASTASDRAGSMADIQVTPYQYVLSGSKLRGGRSLLTPIVRVVPLPAFAWTISERDPVAFEPPADLLPPSARPLLASLPDRAPPPA